MKSPTKRPAERRTRARKLLKEFSLDAMLITGEANVRYLTGFTGDSTYLLILPDKDLLISDFRYITQIEEECPDVSTFIRPSTMSLTAALIHVVHNQQVKRLGIEGHLLTVESHQLFTRELPEVETCAVNWRIEALRAVKDADEIAEIRRAIHIAERGFEYLKAIVTPRSTEIELAHELEHAMRRLGADGVSFPPIIAVGDHAAMPHYHPGDRQICDDPLLLIDWGAQTRSHYKSDLTRTVITSGKKAKFDKVYTTVLEAQRLAIEAIRPGAMLSEVDAAARDSIASAGFGKRFDHGLGHGFGLQIHELPRLSRTSEGVLEPGMVVTVEPGIYLPGWGGVRIEDDILVTRDGCELLSPRISRDLDSVYWSL